MVRSNKRMLSRATMNAAVSCGSNPIHTLMGLIVMSQKLVAIVAKLNIKEMSACQIACGAPDIPSLALPD
jgi:hypothetical protein